VNLELGIGTVGRVDLDSWGYGVVIVHREEVEGRGLDR
jgi:hypothetical protein